MSIKKAIPTGTALLNTGSGITTMTSLEIAELTGKRHDNVMRDIETILIELEIGLLKFEDTYLDGSNRKAKCYNLPKRECTILVSGYSLKMRAAIIDRWQELERQPAFPQTLPEALRLAADAIEQNQLLTNQMEALKPKTEALENLTNTRDLNTITNTAKLIGVKPTELSKYVDENNWCIRDWATRNRIPVQSKIDQGLLVLTLGITTRQGKSFQYKQTMVTGKGLVELHAALMRQAQGSLLTDQSAKSFTLSGGN